ncbi:unnamed protein product [Prunus armeniaca]
MESSFNLFFLIFLFSSNVLHCFVVALRFGGTFFVFGNLVLANFTDPFIMGLNMIVHLLVRGILHPANILQKNHLFNFCFVVLFCVTSRCCLCVPLFYVPLLCFLNFFPLILSSLSFGRVKPFL